MFFINRRKQWVVFIKRKRIIKLEESDSFPLLKEKPIYNESSNNNCKEFNIIINRNKISFKVNIFIPKPFLEQQINMIIRNMKMNKDEKEKYLLYFKGTFDKVNSIRDKIILKPNERRKKLDKRNKVNQEQNKEEIKFGRKTKDDNSMKLHNKYSLDNLITKIKNKLNRSLIEFINTLINPIYDNKQIKDIFV